MSDQDLSFLGAITKVETLACGGEAARPTSAGARSRLAAAIGRQAAGLRATALRSGPELLRSIDLLAQAARRRLPLVVHLAADDDHRAYHAAAATGAALLFASDDREAIDLTLIARRLAEDALVPALVAMDGGTETLIDQDLMPAPETVRRYLGRAGEMIHPPTPCQEMLFGKHRRRVPRWHDVERPLLSGSVLGAEAGVAAAAAGRACFEAHLPELLERAIEAFAEETGRRHDALSSHRRRGAKFLLVAQGDAVRMAESVAERLRENRGPKVDVLGVRALRPLPAARLAELARGHRTVAVLERSAAPAGAETPLAAEIRSALGAETLPRLISVIHGLGADTMREADLEALCHELADKKSEHRSPIYLGLGTASATGYPKLQAHLDAVHRIYPEIPRLGLRAPAEAETGDTGETGARGVPPAAVRRMATASAPLADLAGFWDRTGALHATGGDLVPDPFLASGTVPPMASALTAPPTARDLLPAFDPALCTGCGDCWSACPDGAVGPLPIGPRALLDVGMRLAQRRGRSVDKLRMVTSKLIDRVRQTVATEGGGPLGEILDAAFEPLIDKMKLPDERKAAIRDAYGAVRQEVGELSVARSAPFFDPTGDLFTLAIDPDACQGCGLCVADCEPEALAAAQDSLERVAAAREIWRLHEELPEPEEAVIQTASSHPEIGPLAGALLSGPAREGMAAAATEVGSGEALAARQVLGMAAARRQPILDRHRAEVEELRLHLADTIHRQLSQALPDRDLEALAHGLEALDQPDAELAELTERVETAFETERVDVPGTRRLVDAARQLADLGWRLEKGEGGLGRSPFGLVLAGSPAVWGGTFPHNPFAVPVTVAAPGTAPALAKGLLEGQVRQTLDDVRVLRHARSELERVAGRRSQEGDEELGWATLSAEERALCPPLIVLASEDELGSAALASTLAALDTDLPLKLIAVADPKADRADADLGLLALTATRAHAVQTSIADFEHLGNSLTAALAHEGPALLRVLAPSPTRGDFAADATLDQARSAVDAGDFPLWSSDPESRPEIAIDRLLAPQGAEKIAADVTEVTDPAAHDLVAHDLVAHDLVAIDLVAHDLVAIEPAAAALVDVEELERRHAAEIASLRAQYDAYVAQLRAGLKTEMAQQVRGKLMRLVAGARDADRAPGAVGETPEAEE